MEWFSDKGREPNELRMGFEPTFPPGRIWTVAVSFRAGSRIQQLDERKVELVRGIEPPTSSLQVRASTYWGYTSKWCCLDRPCAAEYFAYPQFTWRSQVTLSDFRTNPIDLGAIVFHWFHLRSSSVVVWLPECSTQAPNWWVGSPLGPPTRCSCLLAGDWPFA